jgi:hypothetical protein
VISEHAHVEGSTIECSDEIVRGEVDGRSRARSTRNVQDSACGWRTSKIVVMDFWSGVLGFFFGLAANNISERWTFYRAHRAAKKLAGEWVAYNYQANNNRSIDALPMPGAGLTVISARPWWRPHSHVLDVYAQDINSGNARNHHGWIAIDPARPQSATRTIFYYDSDEIDEQRILISDDGSTLHVFDESVDGGYSKKHASRRRINPESLY